MRPRSIASSIAALASAILAASAASADCPQMRPTDPGGYAGFAYGMDPVSSYTTPEGRVRVWFATSGPHAPAVAGAAELAGHAVEEAIDGYAAMGFVPVIGDGDYPACASNGGDDRVDVYLVHFANADGLTVAERCAQAGNASRCSGFILAESRLELGYKSFDEGAKTVLPHEYFHLVQDAYNADMDRFWAEGTAQWAAKQIHPDLTDLERFLPAYFSDASRSLDAPPGGVTAAFLYGTAIWPVFLGERHGAAIVREVMEEIGAQGSSALDATNGVLSAKGTSLGAEFTSFTAWNAATGDRAGGGGYPLAASYPMVATTALPSEIGTSIKVVSSGLGARYYLISASDPRVVSIETDPQRNAAVAVPLEGGVARLDRASPLPAKIAGDAVIVVAGQSALKTDAPFTLHVGKVPPDSSPPEMTPPPTKPPMEQEDAGCSIGRTASGALDGGTALALILAAVARLRRRRQARMSCL